MKSFLSEFILVPPNSYFAWFSGRRIFLRAKREIRVSFRWKLSL